MNPTHQDEIDAVEAVMQGKIMQRAELLSVAAIILNNEASINTLPFSSQTDEGRLVSVKASVEMAKLLIEEVNQQFVD